MEAILKILKTQSTTFSDDLLLCQVSNATFEIEQCWMFAVLWRPFWKWWSVEIVQYQESIRDIIIYLHIKSWWYRKMLNLCVIVVAILKMSTARNISMSGINSGHHNLHVSNLDDIRQCWIFAVFYRQPLEVALTNVHG